MNSYDCEYLDDEKCVIKIRSDEDDHIRSSFWVDVHSLNNGLIKLSKFTDLSSKTPIFFKVQSDFKSKTTFVCKQIGRPHRALSV